jgi:hypothetical protein
MEQSVCAVELYRTLSIDLIMIEYDDIHTLEAWIELDSARALLLAAELHSFVSVLIVSSPVPLPPSSSSL